LIASNFLAASSFYLASYCSCSSLILAAATAASCSAANALYYSLVIVFLFPLESVISTGALAPVANHTSLFNPNLFKASLSS
jgi:hypothetical protein